MSEQPRDPSSPNAGWNADPYGAQAKPGFLSTTGGRVTIISVSAVVVLGVVFGVWWLVAGGASGQQDAASRQGVTTSPTPEREETSTLEATAEPSPEAAAAPMVLPGCPDMNPGAQAAAQRFRDEENIYGEGPIWTPADASDFKYGVGPKAQDAMSQALQVQGCLFPLNFHGGVSQWVAELPTEVRESLVSDLRASAYVEGTRGPALTFEYVQPREVDAAGASDMFIRYEFVGNLWIAHVANSPEYDAYLQDGLDAALDLNPSLTS